MEAGLFERKIMQQYYEIREDGGRFLPDRYVEGNVQTVVRMVQEETNAMNVVLHTKHMN